MLDVNPDAYYTMDDLTNGLGWSKASIYKFSAENASPRLPFCKPGKLRCYKGSDLIGFLKQHRFYDKKGVPA